MLAMTTSRPRFRLTADKDGIARIKRLESAEQIAVMQWSANAMRMWPDLRWLFAVPNGGRRDVAEAAHLKRQGVKRGVVDLFLPCARDGFIGLAIEMKVKPNALTEDQEIWLAGLSSLGWQTHVCYSATEAIEVLRAYMQAAPTRIAA
jgi:hypothetical protein